MQSRRSFLGRMAASVGALAVGTTAGCVGTPPGDEGDGATPGPAYASRLYDPTEVVETPDRMFVSHDLATLYERRDLFPDDLTQAIESADEQVEALSVADLDRLTALGYWRNTDGGTGPVDPKAGGSVMLRGSFQPDALVERLRAEASDGVEAAGSAEGHDLYRVPNGDDASSLALAVSEETVFAGGTARLDASGEEAARAMLTADDAGYYRASDTAARLMDALGEATTVFGAEVATERYIPDDLSDTPGGEDLQAVATGLEGAGSAMTLEEDTLTREVVGTYAEGETPERSNVQTLLDLARQGVASGASRDDVETVQSLIDDVEVTVEDRLVTASVSRETDALLDGDGVGMSPLPGGPELVVLLAPGPFLATLLSNDTEGDRATAHDPTPQANFEFEYDAETGEVTITHAGGDAISEDNTGELQVRVLERSVTSWELPVEAGSSITVAADSGDQVHVVWRSPEGNAVALLAEFTVP